MTHEDALSAYVRHHAGQALQGLARFEYESGDALQRRMTVEAVHGTRTSLRRLRATLRTFEKSFSVPSTTDADLRFVARSLSDVRDADVLTQTLGEELEELPRHLVIGPVGEDLTAALTARRRAAVETVDASRTGAPWGRAVERLGAWQQDPPRLVEEQPVRMLKQARDRVRRRIRTADGDLEALHSARKAAKRWRYAAELLAPVEPRTAKHFDAATAVHVLLGHMQDAVVATEFLHEHARLGNRSGHNAFTTGVLHQRAQHRIDDAVRRAPGLV